MGKSTKNRARRFFWNLFQNTSLFICGFCEKDRCTPWKYTAERKQELGANCCLQHLFQAFCHCEPVRRLVWQSPGPMEPGNDYHQKSRRRHSSGCYSVHFPSIRGIATTSVRTGLAMTGYLELSRQTPVFRFCVSADILSAREIPPTESLRK